MPDDQLSKADLPALQALARACLDADGGLPLFAEAPMLRSRLLREQTLAIREAGRLVAAGRGHVDGPGPPPAVWSHPPYAAGASGLRLLRWTPRAGATLTVVTETLGPDAERLYARHGLVGPSPRSSCATTSARCRRCRRRARFASSPGDRGDPADLFTAYAASFADRPGFVEPTPPEWLADLDSTGLAPRPVRGGAGPPAHRWASSTCSAPGSTRSGWYRRGGAADGRVPGLGTLRPWPSESPSPSGSAST